MGEEDVLVEVLINGREVLQFYSTPEHYKTLYEDREALINTVKVAFQDGVVSLENIKNVEDIESVKFLSEVSTETIEVTTEEQPVAQEYEEYEIIHEGTEEAMENLPSSELPEELIIDVGLSSDERLNLCAYCDYRTYNVGHFKIHLRQHTGESPYLCNFCDYKSKQKSNLKRHMRQHIEGKDHFECKLCSFTCSQEKVYKRHMILHSRSRPLRPCPFCDYFSTSLAHLTVHIRQHTGETPYHCGLCSYKTVQKSNLTRHLKKHRKGRISKADKLRCCLYCSYRTPNPAHLMAHVRAAHTGETPYACTHCDYKSAQRSNLKRHLRKHTGERPYQCKLCSYSTAYPYVLKKHIENHPGEEDKLKCEECDYVSYSNVEYKKHIKLHTGGILHCCHICGYVTLSSEHLRTHLRRHSLDRPFKCHHCSYDSSQKSNLKRHLLQKHSGVSTNNQVTQGNNAEDCGEKQSTEILNNDSSNSGTLPEDKLDQNYESGEIEEDPLAIGDGSTNNKEADKEQSYVPDAESTSNAEVLGSYAETEMEEGAESLEVVSEEHVITTTPMEEGEYEMLETEYSEGTYVNGASGVKGSNSKTKNLSFLNKSQAEKLKEFKRLLQQGTQNSHSGTATNKFHTDENSRQINSSDYDNISENTESCTEETVLEEEFQDCAAPDGSFTRTDCSVGQENVSAPGAEVSPAPLSSTATGLHLDEVLPHESSVLIVEHCEEPVEVYEEEEYDYEEGDPEVSSQLCELCGFKARSIGELKAHIRVHTGETAGSPDTYHHCDQCSFKCIRKVDINRHKNSVHGGSPSQMLALVCGVCGYKSGSKEEYLEHSASHTMKCKICDMKLKSPEELRAHNMKHIGEEPFECYYCAYLTARKCHLRSHMKNHSIDDKGPPNKCYTCGFQTDDRATFHKHIGKHRVEHSKPYTCHICRFVTLDAVVYKNHLDMHSGAGISSKNNTFEISKPTEKSEVHDSRTNGEVIKERIPLKEWLLNIPEVDDAKRSIKNELNDKKPMLKDDYFNCTPIKRRRRGLKSLGNEDVTSLIEPRLNRKFNFDIKNLSSSSDTKKSGYTVEFCGEVLKSHGSLRKYTNYGGMLHKNDDRVGTVLSNIENEKQLRLVYDNLKESMLMLKTEQDNAKEVGRTPYYTDYELTIYFKELDESCISLIDESLSDLDLSLSSDNESISLSVNDLDSDIDLEIPSIDVSPSIDKEPDLVPEVNTKKSTKNSVNSELIFDLGEADNVKFLQEKIRQRNEKVKEMRRLKILNVSSRHDKKEVNGMRPMNESMAKSTLSRK